MKALNNGNFDIEFTPNEVGPHQVMVDYGGRHICVEPFVVVTYDVSRIRVMGIKDGMAKCHPSSFVGQYIVFNGFLFINSTGH